MSGDSSCRLKSEGSYLKGDGYRDLGRGLILIRVDEDDMALERRRGAFDPCIWVDRAKKGSFWASEGIQMIHRVKYIGK